MKTVKRLIRSHSKELDKRDKPLLSEEGMSMSEEQGAGSSYNCDAGFEHQNGRVLPHRCGRTVTIAPRLY